MQFPYQIQLLFVFWVLYCYGNFSSSARVESTERRRPECIFFCLPSVLLHFLFNAILLCANNTPFQIPHNLIHRKKAKKKKILWWARERTERTQQGISWWDLVASLSSACSTLHCWKQVRSCCFADFLRVCVTLFQETVAGNGTHCVRAV